MKTIYTTLPVYDSVLKQDYQRTGAVVPVYSPRWRLPAMQWNVETDAPGELQDIELINCNTGESYQDGGTIGITLANGTANPYDTYTIAGNTVNAINIAGTGIGFISDNFILNSKYVYEIIVSISLTSGEYPYISSYDENPAWYPRTSYHQTQAGSNKIWLHNITGSYDHVKFMLYNTAASNFSATITSIKRTLIHSWFAENGIGGDYTDMQQRYGIIADAFLGVYDVVTESNDLRRLTLEKTTAAGAVGYVWADATMAAGGVTAGDEFYIFCHMDYVHGTYPYISVSDYDDATHTLLSNEVQLTDGDNFIVLRVTTTDTPARIILYNKDTELAHFAVTFFYIGRTNIPSIYTALTNDYFQYKGQTLRELMPYGVYYLKMKSANNYVYYSEIFAVTDIYPNLISEYYTNTYDTFTVNGLDIISAINIAGTAYAWSNQFSVIKGETITVICFLTLNSGQAPLCCIDDYGGLGIISNAETLVSGLNTISLVVTGTVSTARFRIYNSAASNYANSGVLVIRQYSADYIKITFDNTYDLGDILYADGFSQTVWLPTRLNTPTHEPVTVGEEKNGIFVAEQVVTKFKFRIVNYCGPALYRALIRLPQHDDIDITDEVGFTYSPAPGNIDVRPMNWTYFDTGSLEIVFNDNSQWSWTSKQNNLT